VLKVTGETPPELIGPEFPNRYAPIWEMFLSIHSGRSYSMGDPNPLSWSDIKAWNDLMRANLKDWEVRAIKALDMVWMRVMGEGVDNGN
jgi:hypothetical protein